MDCVNMRVFSNVLSLIHLTYLVRSPPWYDLFWAELITVIVLVRRAGQPQQNPLEGVVSVQSQTDSEVVYL